MSDCPYCGRTLEEGFLQGSHRLFFVKKYRWLKIDEYQDYLLPYTSLKGSFFPAQYCEHCKTVTISLKEKGE